MLHREYEVDSRQTFILRIIFYCSGLSRAEVFDEMVLFLVAGYETTSTALTWFIHLISKNPRVQERIKDELREHNLLMTGDLEGIPLLTEDKLTSLIYCECVTKEVCFPSKTSLILLIYY